MERSSPTAESDERFVKVAGARQAIGALAEEAEATGRPIAIGTIPARPTHRIVGVRFVDANTRSAAIEISPDEARKNWATIRAVIRVLGAPFVVVMRERPVAIIERHPTFNTQTVDRYLTRIRERSLIAAESQVVPLLHRLISLAGNDKRRER
jgi:hypothetical protein